MRVVGGAAPGEFVQVRLADDHGAGPLETRRHRGVFLGNEIRQDLGPRGRPDAARIDVVLDRDGNAVQGPQVIAGPDHLNRLSVPDHHGRQRHINRNP